MIVAPIAGALSDRIGGHRLMGTGLALQAIGLAWIAAVTTPTSPYVDLVAAVHDLGHRHGALLRPGRERRALVGPRRGGGPGLGREQRDPRARRRLRRRGARVGVRALRRLPVAGDVQRRDGAGGLDRRRSSSLAGSVAAFAIKRSRREEAVEADVALELAA